MHQPETHYATVGNERVAYQVIGDGPVDLVATMGLWGQVDLDWEEPGIVRFLRRLSSFCRVIRFDCRGIGLSDPRPDDGQGPIQHWSEDLLAVLHAVGCESVSIFGWIDGGNLALQFAATHPEKVRSMVLMNASAHYIADAEYPQGFSAEAWGAFQAFTAKCFGTEQWATLQCPSLVKSEHASTRRWHAKWQRAIGSPKEMVAGIREQARLDARSSLQQVRVETLILGQPDHPLNQLSHQRFIAERVRGARLVELPGRDLMPYWENPDRILDQIEEFLTGQRRGREAERSLLTVLFTDIVDSTALATKMGDAPWHELLNRHDDLTRDQINRFGGKLIERTGDGTLATFDRPGRAIDCAHALHDAMKSLGIGLRAGLHTAEVERRDDGRVGGIGVHIAARVTSKAKAGEVLVSPSIQFILMGSTYRFRERGTHELKGLNGTWPLYAVECDGTGA